MIVMRKDLKCRTGKYIAQGSHASMAVLLNAGQFDDGEVMGPGGPCQGQPTFTLNLTPVLQNWLSPRLKQFTKICVSVDSEQELLEVYQKALTAH
jgi:PTH2 family peptidyl-tRNA hydrolase